MNLVFTSLFFQFFSRHVNNAFRFEHDFSAKVILADRLLLRKGGEPGGEAIKEDIKRERERETGKEA